MNAPRRIWKIAANGMRGVKGSTGTPGRLEDGEEDGRYANIN